MILRRIFAALALLCALIAPAHAQKTKAAINTEIGVQFPDNVAGQITPLNLRNVTLDIINSIMPTAPVGAGNLACFSGTTGLLQDCGTLPAGNPLVVATTPITGGIATRVLFDNAGILGEYLTSGSGNVCMTTLCVMTTPNLGTPSAATLTNATGLPVSTGISGLGTGVATALAVNVGTAGSPVVNGGALGTPSSGVATNLTGTAAGLTPGTNANLTGPVTSVGNATTIGVNQVSRTNEAQGIARSVIGVTGNATANVADIQGAAGTVLAVNSAGTALTFVGPGQVPGEPSTGSATSGNAGEYIESIIVVGSAVSLVSATDKTITSISLTAGDWDVDAVANFLGNVSTSFTVLAASFSTTTNVSDLTTAGRSVVLRVPATLPGANSNGIPIPPYRFSLSATTSIFLIGTAVFSAGTENGWGIIRARRVR